MRHTLWLAPLLLLLLDPSRGADLSSSGVFNCGIVTCPQQNVLVVEQLGKFRESVSRGTDAVEAAWREGAGGREAA